MRNWFSCCIAALLMAAGHYSTADDGELTHTKLENCRAKVLALQTGTVNKIELKIEDGEQVYEFDIRDSENRDWDIECHAMSGEIIEIEEEVFGVSDARFSRQMKVGLDRAREVALERYPGEIIEIEYELEADGTAVYEFDISTKDGREMKIEIDAATGLFHEETREIWQYGYE